MTPIQTFRSQFWFTFRYIFQLAAFSALVAMLIEDGLNLNWDAFRIGSAVGAIIGFVLTGFAILYFTVTVFREGISSYDFWMRYHTVEWSAMTQARSLNLVGLRYVCVDFEDNARTLWIPKFLRDYGKFCELVKDHAGESNPLYRELVA